MKTWLRFALIALVLSTAKCSVLHADEIYDWSNAAANNNNAPPDGFPENMNYSEVNDAARELMAVVKRYVEAVDGTNTTAGTEPAYTLSSGQSLGAAAGHIHVWTAHATSTGSVTLNVDAAGAKNLVDSTGTQVGSGGIVSGGVYMSVETASNHRLIGSLATPAVTGPASSTDNAVARFNGTGGTTVQNSGVIIDDSNNITGVGTLSSGAITSSGSITGTTVELGGVTDATLARSGAGDATIEGNALYRAGGTDVPVTDGGNGRSSATAYAVITGGTTSTGAHQSIASVGTSGQVLTSNGAGQLPTFEDAAGGGGTDVQSFTSSGTWTKPAGFDVSSPVLVRAWGAGGSGGQGGSGNGGGGGGGGAYVEGWFLLSDLGATETVTIGAGGASRTTAQAGDPGDNTTFGSLVTAYGGEGGEGNATTNAGGGGGGLLSAGSGTTGGSPGGGTVGVPGGDSSFGGGGGGTGADLNAGHGGSTVYGGGGGGGGTDNDSLPGSGSTGGETVYGGGGGGGGGANGSAYAGGTSTFGGNGGAGAGNASNATAGTQPSGGGGGSETGDSGAGADGQIEVYVFSAG